MVDEVGPHVDVQVYTYTCSVQFSCVVLCSVHQYEYLYSSSFLVFTNKSIVALPPSSIYISLATAPLICQDPTTVVFRFNIFS